MYGHHRLDNGETLVLTNEDDDPFFLEKGTEISMVTHLDTLERIAMGYRHGGRSVTEYTADEKKTLHRMDFTIPENGEYSFFVRNLSIDSIMIDYVEIEDI